MAQTFSRAARGLVEDALMKTPSYHAGRILGMRDAQDHKPLRDTRRETTDFRKGYCDGYHRESGGLQF